MGIFESLAESYYDKQNGCKRTTWIIIGSIFAFCIIIIGFALIGVSVNKKIENNEYGIEFHKSTTMEFGKIHEQGIYSIPPGSEMLIFVRTLQDVDSGIIDCFSSDKIVIKLTIAVQYQLVKEQIIPIILKKFDGNDNFKNILKFIVQNIIINRCGQFTAENYYDQRAIIDKDMYDSLVAEVNNNTLGATIEFFQLINIQFPDKFSQAISEKQITIQKEITTLNERTSLIIQANTSLLQAKRQAEIILINAQNTVNINLRQANTTKLVVENQWVQRGLAFNSIKTSLNLTQEQFIQYLKSEIIRTRTNAIISI